MHKDYEYEIYGLRKPLSKNIEQSQLRSSISIKILGFVNGYSHHKVIK